MEQLSSSALETPQISRLLSNRLFETQHTKAPAQIMTKDNILSRMLVFLLRCCGVRADDAGSKTIEL